MADDSMIEFLAAAAKEARENAQRKPIHIAVVADVDQSTIWRFEHGKWPRNADEIIAAYAAELEIDPRQLWTRALEMWISGEKPSTELAAEAVQAATAAAQGRKRSTRRSAGKRPSTAKRRAAG